MRLPPHHSLILLYFLLSTAYISSLASSPSQPQDPQDPQDPFNIIRSVDAHAVAERNAERSIAAADSRAREAEKRAAAADAAASASRDLALHFQIESNTRLARAHALEEEVEKLKFLLSSAVLDKEALMVRGEAVCVALRSHVTHKLHYPHPPVLLRFPPVSCCRPFVMRWRTLSQASCPQQAIMNACSV
jgi:alkanesulfonate monooxygenase SsuD/methylene tetrahydromethanopterin reductase-like flavin-dependent oxidoreductase (luciferase family)